MGMNDPRFLFVLDEMVLNLLDEGRRTHSLVSEKYLVWQNVVLCVICVKVVIQVVTLDNRA